MMKIAKRALLALSLITAVVVVAGTQTGCASLLSAQTAATTAVDICNDGEIILNAVKSFVTTYFIAAPNATLQAQINAAIDKANEALDAGLRATTGVSDLTDDQVTAAFADFRSAYTDLLALVQPLGVQQAAPTSSGRFATSGRTKTLPRPMAFR